MINQSYIAARYKKDCIPQLAGRYAAIDTQSGYPFVARQFNSIFLWPNDELGENRCKEYLKICPALEMVRVSISLKEAL